MAALALMALQSCSTSLEEQILGSWRLSKSSIPKLDSIAQARSKDLSEGLASTLEMLNDEIDTCYREPERTELMSRRDEVKQNISGYSPENIKKLFLEQQEQLKDSLLFVFDSDKHIVIRLGSNDVDNVNSGNWTIKGDTSLASFDSNPSEYLIVRNVNSGSLVLESLPLGIYGVGLMLEFSKI